MDFDQTTATCFPYARSRVDRPGTDYPRRSDFTTPSNQAKHVQVSPTMFFSYISTEKITTAKHKGMNLVGGLFVSVVIVDDVTGLSKAVKSCKETVADTRNVNVNQPHRYLDR
jgi:hypothetical protein